MKIHARTYKPLEIGMCLKIDKIKYYLEILHIGDNDYVWVDLRSTKSPYNHLCTGLVFKKSTVVKNIESKNFIIYNPKIKNISIFNKIMNYLNKLF